MSQTNPNTEAQECVEQTAPEVDKAQSAEQAPERKPKKADKKKNAELEKVTAELEQTKDMLLRTAAEFDNFKRRSEKEKTDLSEYVKAATVKNFLSVADNIKRAADSDKESPDYVKGLEMIIKQLSDTLTKLGLEEIEALGQPFDPNFHEAVMHIEDDSFGENTVSQVLQTGYKLGDTVLRPSMVQVAN